MYDGRGAPYRFPQMRCQYAGVLARLGKPDEAFAQLKLAVDEAKEFDGRPDTWTAASLLLGEWRETRAGVDSTDSRPCREIMRDKWLQHPDFDPIRGMAEFKEIEAALSA